MITMHVSVRTLYALRALSKMAEDSTDQSVHARDLAEELDMSKDYLNQILGTLRKAGLVRTKKGPHGGFRLAREPADISLGEVINILEGPTIVSDCTEPEHSDCDVIQECSTQSILSGVSERIMEYLHTISIEDIHEEKDLPPLEPTA
jgi:Rrf2 family protein